MIASGRGLEEAISPTKNRKPSHNPSIKLYLLDNTAPVLLTLSLYDICLRLTKEKEV